MLAGFSSVGFAGSRSGVGSAAAARLAAAAAAAGCGVFATCGRGVPAAAAAVPGSVVFRRSSPPFSSLPFRVSLAARATAFIRALAAAPAPALVCWPGRAAPSGLRPSRSWSSCGSGSWSEAALAAGLGVTVFVFLPPGIQPPAAWGRWFFVSSGLFAGSFRFVAAIQQPLI